LAKRYGGFGGGHKRAGGAGIPRKDCIAFIKNLEIERARLLGISREA
jgi:nanoRNase/pAp phosphatase (c-di-AMP/oligoRNAs hydrolase)